MGRNRFLVTGAQGFIGSWVTRNLLDREHEVIALDVHSRPVRLSLLISPEKLKKIRFVRGDINRFRQIKKLVEDCAVSHVIHLAGVQTPECRAKPILGAVVNVLGTLTLFEAIKACKDQVKCVVYASSGAVLGTDEDYGSHPIGDDAPRIPGTLYGVYKATNEECARIYWQDEGIRSVGLRPPVVYGVGRDKGLTAGTTLAIKAAMLGQPYEIGFGGAVNVEYADDVANSFIACALKAPEGAPVYNMRGEVLEVDDMIAVIEDIFPLSKGEITCAKQRNIMANDVSDAGLQSLIGPLYPLSYEEGAKRTANLFQTLLRDCRL
ncbi:MAG: SDR family oxidoreductase [Spirochaetaceae bacterium]|nr:MAG: SDR family oxidoreductase [Spirochaetaceae bacterium]